MKEELVSAEDQLRSYLRDGILPEGMTLEDILGLPLIEEELKDRFGSAESKEETDG